MPLVSHPRLLVTSTNLAAVKARLGTGGVWETDFQTWIDWADAQYATALSSSLANLIFLAADYAFLYMTHGVTGASYGHTQAQYGTLARDILIEISVQSSVVGNYDWYGVPLAYDWVHPLLSSGDKTTLVTLMKTIDDFDLSPPTASAFDSQVTVGRSQALLSALAFADDGVDDAWATAKLAQYSEYYEPGSGVTGSESVLAGEDGGCGQGMQYGFYTYPQTFLAEESYRTAYDTNATTFYSPAEKSYLRRYAQYILYYILPWAPGGDYIFWKSEQTTARTGAQTGIVQSVLTAAIGVFESVDADIAALAQWLLDNRTGPMESGDAFYRLHWGFWKFALGNQTTPATPTDTTMPLSKQCNDGHCFFRYPDWEDVNGTLLTFNVNQWHRDPAGMSPNFPGGFTIDRNGPLAIRQGGTSGHDFGASGHANCNIIQFVDTTQTSAGPYPDDDQGGGRMLPGDLYGSVNFVENSDYDLRGEVRFLSHDNVDRDVDYSRCDTTRGYSSTPVSPPDNPARVAATDRSIVYFRPETPGDTDRFVIFDRAESTNIIYKKRWLFHTSGTPTVNGVETVGVPERPAGVGLGKWSYTSATLVTDSNTEDGSDGKIFLTPVLPAGRTIVRVGGPNSDGDSWFTVPPSHEYENCFGELTAGADPGAAKEQYVGQYRIEIIPTVDSLYDTFLNVIETGDTSMASPTPVIPLLASNLVACRVGNRVAVFGSVAGDVTTGEIIMDAASGTYRFHFADLTPSTSYTVTVGGVPQSEVSTAAGTLYLELAVTGDMSITLGPFVSSSSRAITLNGASDYLVRTTGNVPASSDYSCIFWTKLPVVVSGGYRTYFLQVDDAAGAYSQFAGLFSNTDTDDILEDINNGSGGAGFSTAVNLISKKWYPHGYVREGTDHRIYVNGILHATIVSDFSATTLGEQYLGSDTFSTGQFQFLGFREWDKAKDLAGLIVEWNSPTAVDTVNLWSDTPNGVNDVSGNGRDWTVVGTPVFDDNPPVQIPLTNTSSGAAYVIPSLPFNAIQVTKDSAGVLQSSWYNYTGQVGDGEASLLAFGNPTTYEPRLRIDIDDTSTNLGEIPANDFDNIPILEGRLYIFRAYELSPSATSASLELTIKTFTNVSIPLGTILIRAASITNSFIDAGYTGLGAGYIDATNGDIINYNTDVIPGESGDYLPDTGEILYGDEYINPGNLVLFDNALNIIATIPYDTVSFPIIRTNREGRKFYVGNRGSSGLAIPIEYVTVDELGNISAPTVMVGVGMTAIAASPDESIVYVAGVGSSVGAAIKQWDVSGAAFIADLVAGVANHIIQDILVMSDGTLVVCYQDFNSPFATFIRLYDPAGATISTYTPTLTAAENGFATRLGYANDDSVSFWVLLHQNDGFSAFRNVRVSDLVELQSFETPSSDYLTISHGPDPEFDFVVSNTCPIVLIVGDTPPPVTGSITVIKVVVPASAIPEFDFTTTGGLTPSTFSLNHGDEQVFNDLEAGTYGVTETAEAGYTTSYEVSNGDPHGAIELAEGEDVTVTVTNTLNVLPPGEGGGIYKIVPGKLQDTLWTSLSPPETIDVEIPNPFADTAFIGD